MKLEWKLESRYQWLYYIKLCRTVQKGFFQQIRAIVLPYLHEDGWFVPDYGLFVQKEFTELLNKLPERPLMVINNEELIQMVADIWNEKLDLRRIEVQQIEANQIWEHIYPNLVNFFPKLREIEAWWVVPVSFGTFGSFCVEEVENKKIGIINYRIDKGIWHLFHCIYGIVTQYVMQADEMDLDAWTSRQAAMDMLMESSMIGEFFPEKKGIATLKYLDEYKGELVVKSAEYFRKIGVEIKGRFNVIDELVYWDELPISRLSRGELRLLRYLVEHKSELVLFDDLARVYWGEDWEEKFSTGALSKVVERLRESLRRNAVYRSCIYTVRKQGYVLYD